MIYCVTIRYCILYITDDGRDPIYDIIGYTKRPHLLYHS